MKTYTVEVSAEKALDIYEAEKLAHMKQAAALDVKIRAIRAELAAEQSATSTGSVLTSIRRRSLAAVNDGLDILNGNLEAIIADGIKKTASGRFAKGDVEEVILQFFTDYPSKSVPTQFFTKTLNANFSTVYRSLKKLEHKGLVSFNGNYWKKTDKLEGASPK